MGGHEPRDRGAAARAGRTVLARVRNPCGTDAAYRRHLRAGERACDRCLTAHRSYEVVARARRAGGVAA